MKSRILVLLSGLTAALFSCQAAPGGNEDPLPEPPAETAEARVYTTSTAGLRMKESAVTLGKPEDVNFYKVTLSGESFQTVDGFGLAVTQASCYNLLLMSASASCPRIRHRASIPRRRGRRR